ncbi:MAG: PIG-L family deacetylase [Burkholderiaceae bacterium]
MLLALTLDPSAGATIEVLCIGAHCDDIEIGCGGTVMAVQKRYPRCKVHLLVLTSNAARRAEAAVAARALIKASARGEVRICALPDGLLPAHLPEVKAEFERMKRMVDPGLVLTHHGLDRHQDHSLVSHVTWQTFRNNMIWEYEIPKFDGDLVTPNMYVPLPSALASRKINLLMRTFASQRNKPWFKADNLTATMRLRGVECRATSGYAEGFHCRKLLSDVASIVPRSGARKR